MPQVALADLTNIVTMDLSGVPDPVAEIALLDAARAFCEESLAWRIWLTVPLVDGMPTYDLSNVAGWPATSSLVMVTDAWIGQKPIPAPGLDEIRERLPDWATVKGGPAFLECASLSPPLVTLFPMPGATDATPMRIQVAMRPARGSDGIEEFLVESHDKALRAGARARLLAMKGQAWSGSAADIRAEEDAFTAMVGVARIKATRGNAVGSSRMKARAFGE
jgi:hypothetical protein